MMGKNESKEDRSVENEIRANGFGHIIQQMIDEKKLPVSKLCTDLGTSRFRLAVDPSSMSRILNGERHFRADYLYPILEVAELDLLDFMDRCKELSEESMESGRLYYKRPYHPRRDRKEDDN